jgi:hypothetical protein
VGDFAKIEQNVLLSGEYVADIGLIMSSINFLSADESDIRLLIAGFRISRLPVSAYYQ